MEVVPCNWAERYYTLAVVLLGLLIFSSFVSSITTSMTHLRAFSAEETRKMDRMKKYIVDNRISLQLGSCIFSYLRKGQADYRFLHIQELELYKVLPESLQTDLWLEVAAPVLTSHPLFHRLTSLDEQLAIQTCRAGISEKYVTPDETVFSVGEMATCMQYTLIGKLRYYMGSSRRPRETVRSHWFIAEVALWAIWSHLGRLVASRSCEMLVFDATRFHHLASVSKLLPEMQAYALLFLAEAQGQGPYFTDVTHEPEKLEDMTQQAFSHLDVDRMTGKPSTTMFGTSLWKSRSLLQARNYQYRPGLRRT